MRIPGGFCLLAYVLHVGAHVGRGAAENGLWACHVGALLCGIGLLAENATCNAMGVFWLSVGVPLWLVDLVWGGGFLVTTLLTHVGALAMGILGIRRLGVPAGTWWRALLALVGLVALTRMLTPPGSNVNLAHRVHESSVHLFPSHLAYLAVLTMGTGLAFLGLERGLARACACKT